MRCDSWGERKDGCDPPHPLFEVFWLFEIHVYCWFSRALVQGYKFIIEIKNFMSISWTTTFVGQNITMISVWQTVNIYVDIFYRAIPVDWQDQKEIHRYELFGLVWAEGISSLYNYKRSVTGSDKLDHPLSVTWSIS